MTYYTKKKLADLTKSESIVRNAKNTELYLNKVCTKVWAFLNPKLETIVYGKYVNGSDETIVSLGYKSETLNKFLTCK